MIKALVNKWYMRTMWIGLLFLGAVIGCFPSAAAAAPLDMKPTDSSQEIKVVAVSQIVLPKAEEHPTFHATVPADANYHIASVEELEHSGYLTASENINGLWWVDLTAFKNLSKTDKFEGRNEYRCELVIVPNKGYHFSDALTVSINDSTFLVEDVYTYIDDNTGELFLSSVVFEAESAEYRITFDVDGDSTYQFLTKDHQLVGELPTPIKKGYIFEGWFSEMLGGDVIETPTAFMADTRLYAHWKKDPAMTTALPFIDVKKSDWFYNDVDYVYGKHLMQGLDSQHFGPQQTTTRGMIVAILYRWAGSPAVIDENPFKDVKKGMYYEGPIAWAAANGIVNGYRADTFGPDDPITREQLAAMLYSYAGSSMSFDWYLDAYKDGYTVSPWAQPAVSWAIDRGLISGIGDGYISPRTNATRAQVAAIFHRT